MTLREKLIVLRDKAGISQMALAHQLGVSRQAVSRWESGDATPSMDKLKALAKIYNVTLDWLCNDSDMITFIIACTPTPIFGIHLKAKSMWASKR